MACIGEPVSWLRLEAFQLGTVDPQIDEHLVVCEACRSCLDEIRADVVALPPLVAPVRARRRWTWIAPAMALAAAAIVLIVLRTRPDAAGREDVATIKGVGEVILGTIREREGAIATDAPAFRPTDRWKVVVTCPPDALTWVDVAIVEVGATSADHPMAPAHVACGNRVVVPGAFTLSGGVNRVCVRLATEAAPQRGLPRPGEAGVACVTIRPE
jgi:hypothetical protein